MQLDVKITPEINKHTYVFGYFDSITIFAISSPISSICSFEYIDIKYNIFIYFKSKRN